MRALLCLSLVVACSKSEPKQGPPPPSAAARPAATPGGANAWREADPGKPIAQELADAAAAAGKAGQKPYAYLHADWCEPCVAIGKTKDTDSKMKAAFAGTAILAIDVDKADAAQLEAAGLKSSAIPVFFKLDAAGKPTGDRIDGGAWGDNIPDNMAPPLAAFFAK